MPVDTYDAIILAGGAGSRLGGLDKAAVPLAGTELIGSALRAVSGASTLVIVGDTRANLPVAARRTVEDPPGGGPAAATVAGLDAVTDPQPWTVLLACDLPGADRALPLVLAAAAEDSAERGTDSAVAGAAAGAAAGGEMDGAVLIDADGRPQWVLGVYRTCALRRAQRSLGDPRDRSLRSLLGSLALRRVPADRDDWRDVDTWADHDEWTARLRPDTDSVAGEG